MLKKGVKPKASKCDANGAAEDDGQFSTRLCGRVRRLRKDRGWTLEELSAASGVSRSMLSEIEREHANPTLAVAFRIARAFGMSIGELADAPADANAVDVIRGDDPAFHYRNDRQCSIRTLSPLRLEKTVEFYEVRLHAGRTLKSGAHFTGARELLTVKEGAVRVTSAKEVVDLGPGDSAYYPADVTHEIQSTSEDESVLFLVVTYVRD